MTEPTAFLRRLALVAVVAFTALGLISARVVYLGVVSAHGAPRDPPVDEIPAQRGGIWDREGGPLAVNAYVYRVGVARNEVKKLEEVAAAVGSATGHTADEVRAWITDADGDWIPLARTIPAAEGHWLRSLHLPGVHVTAEAYRAYPLGEAAAHLTGFVSLEGKGYYGVEGYYDGELAGRQGRMAGRDGTDPQRYLPPTHGSELVLTVDRELQLAAAEALADAVDQQDASGGSVLILDPRTGAILASTSLPSYHPEHFLEVDEATWLDPTVSDTLEPGSTLKAITTAAALDSGAVDLAYQYEDQGFIEYAGLRITNWDHLSHGPANLTTILRHSLNVGAVHLALQLGAERFYRYLTAFGFGELTDVDLASEQAGILHSPATEGDSWYEGHLATNAFGQGLSATPLQVARAIAAIANDGALMVPYVVAARIYPDGHVERTAPQVARQVIAPATARAMRDLLAEAVEQGIPQAHVEGYRVAGKTGTSQIPTPNGPSGYDPEATIASFVGMLPADNPQVLIFVKVDRPRARRGSDVAAPAFREVAQAAITELGIPPDPLSVATAP